MVFYLLFPFLYKFICCASFFFIIVSLSGVEIVFFFSFPFRSFNRLLLFSCLKIHFHIQLVSTLIFFFFFLRSTFGSNIDFNYRLKAYSKNYDIIYMKFHLSENKNCSLVLANFDLQFSSCYIVEFKIMCKHRAVEARKMWT